MQKYEKGGAFEVGQCAVPLLKVTKLNVKIIQHSKLFMDFSKSLGNDFTSVTISEISYI